MQKALQLLSFFYTLFFSTANLDGLTKAAWRTFKLDECGLIQTHRRKHKVYLCIPQDGSGYRYSAKGFLSFEAC